MPPAIFSSDWAMFSMRQPKEPVIRYCCWKSCIRLMLAVGPEVAPQVTSRPPRFRHKQRAVPGIGPDMLEDDVDALPPGQLADDALEAVLAVVDDVVGAERLRLARPSRRRRRS